MDKLFIFDTTLRDGEQVPGCQLNTVEKIQVAKQLEALGVDVIEAGFPISSPGDFNSVIEISKAVTWPTICALTPEVAQEVVGPVIRQDWLREFGMEVPRTYDELYDYLKKSYDEKGAIYEDPSTDGLFFDLAYGQNIDLDGYEVVDGQVEFGLAQDRAKDYFKFMNRIYETKYSHEANVEDNGNYQWADWLSYEPLESCGGGINMTDRSGKRVRRPEAIVYWNYLSASYWAIDAGMMADMAAFMPLAFL